MNYRIGVQGQLDESWSDWFEGMTITVERSNDHPPTTTLAGVIPDQTALLGILLKIHDLNLTVTSVKAVEMDEFMDERSNRRDQ